MASGITLSSQEVLDRRDQICSFLSPLAPILWVDRQSKGGMVVLAAHTGIRGGADPEDWLFDTHITGFWGNYFERWNPTDASESSFVLERAYFHLYCSSLSKNEARKRVLAVHCEARPPNDSNDYESGIHLHVLAADDPLHRAHFAFDICNRDALLSSLHALDDSLRTSFAMISHEVLGHRHVGELRK